MSAGCLRACAIAVGLVALLDAQAPGIRIDAPTRETVVSGRTRIDASLTAPELAQKVETVTFFVNGRTICTTQQRAPWRCEWDAGDVVRAHHIRVVATLDNGQRLTANLHTKDLGYAENVRTDAVLVPVIVTDGGNFVPGLTKQDFELFEDNVRQPIATFVSEKAPLDLVLAVDVSGSMEDSLPAVKASVKQLLSKLRPGDAVTLLGFNDTTFTVAEREKDARVREEAVDLLSAWGGTALFDATVRVLDLVSRDFGRKGVIIFSDGDDRNSLTSRDAALARVQSSDAMVYTIGFGGATTVPRLRASLESYARATGGRAFFPRQVKDLDGVFDQIVAELANQYVLSYAPPNLKLDNSWHTLKVRVRNGKYEIRSRGRYRASKPQGIGR